MANPDASQELLVRIDPISTWAMPCRTKSPSPDTVVYALANFFYLARLWVRDKKERANNGSLWVFNGQGAYNLAA